MKTRRSIRKPRPATRRGAGRLRILLGAAAVASMLTIALAGGTRLVAFKSSEAAQGSPESGQSKPKKYKGTRAFVQDKQTGDVRLPNQQEVDEVVANLTTLGQRPSESLQQTGQPNGVVSLDLDGGFNGIVLGRPNGDGTWETKCVFSLEEGIEFLGIVADDASQ